MPSYGNTLLETEARERTHTRTRTGTHDGAHDGAHDTMQGRTGGKMGGKAGMHNGNGNGQGNSIRGRFSPPGVGGVCSCDSDGLSLSRATSSTNQEKRTGGSRCRENRECETDVCKGNWGGLKWGVCTAQGSTSGVCREANEECWHRTDCCSKVCRGNFGGLRKGRCADHDSSQSMHLWKEEGDACRNNEECASGTCEGGVCVTANSMVDAMKARAGMHDPESVRRQWGQIQGVLSKKGISIEMAATNKYVSAN